MFSTSDSWPAVEEIAWLIWMPPAPPPAPASRVSVASPPAVFAIVASTVMLPAWFPPELSVVIVTEVPAFREVTIVPASTFELSAFGVKVFGVPLSNEPFVVALVMSTLESGSSSHCPALPCGAEASTLAVTPIFRNFLPDVSTNPPSPPCAPPLARMVPLNLVVPSDQTVTLPPLPLATALASIAAPAATAVFLALARVGSLPCAPPPIFTVPPPADPRALILAEAERTVLSPVTPAVPPV